MICPGTDESMIHRSRGKLNSLYSLVFHFRFEFNPVKLFYGNKGHDTISCKDDQHHAASFIFLSMWSMVCS